MQQTDTYTGTGAEDAGTYGEAYGEAYTDGPEYGWPEFPEDIEEDEYIRRSRRISALVPEAGWERHNAGESAVIDYNYRFDLYIRRRKLSEMVSRQNDGIKISSIGLKNSDTKTLGKIKDSDNTQEKGSFQTLGSHSVKLNPSRNLIAPVTKGQDRLPVLSSFQDYLSLAAIRRDDPAIVIAFDSEWYYPDNDGHPGHRAMLTWQFSAIQGEYLLEYVFVRKNEKHGLSLELALGRILDSLGVPSVDIRSVRKYEAITGINEATGKDVTTLFG